MGNKVKVLVTVRSNRVQAEKDSIHYKVTLNTENHFEEKFEAYILDNSKLRYGNVDSKEIFPVQKISDNEIVWCYYNQFSNFVIVSDDSGGNQNLQQVLENGSVAFIDTIFGLDSENIKLATGSTINVESGAELIVNSGSKLTVGSDSLSNDILIQSSGSLLALGNSLDSYGADENSKMYINAYGGVLQFRSGTVLQDVNGTLTLMSYNENGLIADNTGLKYSWTGGASNFYKFPASRGNVGDILTQQTNGILNWSKFESSPLKLNENGSIVDNRNTSNSYNSIALGENSANNNNGNNMIVIGNYALQQSSETITNYCISIGYYSGNNAQSSDTCIFIGSDSGRNSQYNNRAIFIGADSGRETFNSDYSILIGYSAGKKFGSNQIGENNIIIGNNISLPNTASNSLNIGGLLYGTDISTYNGIDPAITPSINGKLGVGIVNPTEKLEVNGEIKAANATKNTNVPTLGQVNNLIDAKTLSYLLSLNGAAPGNVLSINATGDGLEWIPQV